MSVLAVCPLQKWEIRAMTPPCLFLELDGFECRWKVDWWWIKWGVVCRGNGRFGLCSTCSTHFILDCLFCTPISMGRYLGSHKKLDIWGPMRLLFARAQLNDVSHEEAAH